MVAGVCTELLDCSGLDLAAHLTSEAGDSGELVQGIVAACSLATQQCAQTVMMVSTCNSVLCSIASSIRSFCSSNVSLMLL